jgi:hypothetical protein
MLLSGNKKTSRRMREVSASGDVAQLPDALSDNDHGKSGHGSMLPHSACEYQVAGMSSHMVVTYT